jgi:hypothetical protein
MLYIVLSLSLSLFFLLLLLSSSVLIIKTFFLIIIIVIIIYLLIILYTNILNYINILKKLNCYILKRDECIAKIVMYEKDLKTLTIDLNSNLEKIDFFYPYIEFIYEILTLFF